MSITFTTTERIYVMSGLRTILDNNKMAAENSIEDYQKRSAQRTVDTITSALNKFEEELEAAAASLVGREVTFSFEPYHSGTGTVQSLERRNSPHVKGDTYWTIVIAVTSGSTVSRLMGQSSVSPLAYETMDCPVSDHWILEAAADEETPFVRYVYSC